MQEILLWLGAVLNPDQSFVHPADPYIIPQLLPYHERTQYFASDGTKPAFSIKPFYQIFLASLDPAIAMMLGLMYIDTKADADKAYDYTVLATWEDWYTGQELSYCAILNNLASSQPVPIPENFEGEPLKGITWQSGEPKRRVGLKWSTPENNQPETPVLFDLYRDGASLTQERPILRNNQSDKFCYIDPLVPVGERKYCARGIDLFGRVSQKTSVEVNVLSEAVPPPPIMVQAELVPPEAPQGSNASGVKLRVGWQWRFFQYRRTADVDRFRVHFRPESLVDTMTVTVEPAGNPHEQDDTITVTVSPATDDPKALAGFVGGTLSRLADGNKLPKVAERATYRVSENADGVTDSTMVILRPPSSEENGSGDAQATRPLEAGNYLLRGNARNRSNWQEPIAELPVMPPIPIPGQIISFSWIQVHIKEVTLACSEDGAPLLFQESPVYNINVQFGFIQEETIHRGLEGIRDLDRAASSRTTLSMRDFKNLLVGQVLQKDGEIWEIIPDAVVDESRPHRQPSLLELQKTLAVSANAEPDRTGLGTTTSLAVVSPDESGTAPTEGVYQVFGLWPELSFKPDLPLAPDVEFPPGGELAVPQAGQAFADGFSLGGQSEYIGCEIVSPVEKLGEGLGFWLKAPNPDAQTIDLAQGQVAYFFPAYQVELGCPAALQPDIHHPAKLGYVAVSAVVGAKLENDYHETEGPLSSAVQVTNVCTQVPRQPNPPYPKGKKDAESGYARPPDFHGKSFFALEWDLPEDVEFEPVEAGQEVFPLRYEVYRALDKSIIQADHENWQTIQGHYAIQVPDGNSFRDEFVDALSAQTESGKETVEVTGYEVLADGVTVLLSTEPQIGPTQVGKLTGGALEYTPQSGESIRFPIVALVRSKDATYFKIRRRKKAASSDAARTAEWLSPPSSGPITLLPPPDYEAILKNLEVLQAVPGEEAGRGAMALTELADLPGNERAFNLVTRSPLLVTRPSGSTQAEGNTLTDVLPGRGRNCFFYRVRSLDRAGNRSPLSRTSVPVHLVDTSPPATPLILKAMGGDRKAAILWQKDSDDRVVRYKVYRAVGKAHDEALLEELDETNCIRELHVSPEDSQERARPVPIVKQFGAIDLDIGVAIPEGIQVGGSGVPRFTGVYKKDSHGNIDEAFNYLVEDPTRLEGRTVINVNPGLAEGTPVVLVLSREGDPPLPLITDLKNENPLVVSSQAIDFSFPYNITEILGVYKANEFDFYADPITDQTVENHFVTGSAYDDTQHVISSLSPNLEDGYPVVVLAKNRRSDGNDENIVIQDRAGSNAPLQAQAATVSLDLDFSPTGIYGIFKAEAYDEYSPPDEQSALNYLMKKTEFEAEGSRTLRNLNPLLGDGDEVVIRLLNAQAEVMPIDAIPTQLVFVDTPVEGLLKDEVYCYRLVAIKRVRKSDDEFIEVPSRSTGLIKLNAFDTTPPDPPEWIRGVWWDRANNVPADDDTGEPVVLLEWETPYPEAKCTVLRKYEEGGWKQVANDLEGELDTSTQRYRFVYLDDTIDKAKIYAYRIQIRNRLGKLNDEFNEMILEGKSP